MKALYVMIMLLVLAGGLLAQATDLFISEYVEGTSYNKAIEIYNGTGAAVDLANYSLKKQTNGAGAFASELTLTGTLANDDVYVIVSSATGGTNLANQPFVDLATMSQAVNFNGNDAVALYHNGTQIDVVGVVDSPDNWGQNMTLVRNATVFMPTVNFNMNEWTQYPVDTFTYLGDHEFSGGGSDPIILVSSPNGGETWYRGETHNVTWSSANVTGNVKIELDNAGTLTTLAATTENDGTWEWQISNDTSMGTQFKVKVSNIAGTVSDMSNEVFAISEVQTIHVANMAALRQADADAVTHYVVDGQVILTYQQTYRHKKYIQDSTGAVEIDDNEGIITTPYQIGDAIAGVTGTLSVYHNLLQFTPLADPGEPVSSGNEITIPQLTIAQINANEDMYESMLVRINNAQFADTSAPFATGTNYVLNDPTGTLTFRTAFYDADYIGQPMPTGAFNVKVIVSQYDATNQVAARSMADFGPVAVSDESTNPMIVRNSYPNPFNDHSSLRFELKASSHVSVSVYNGKGQFITQLADGVYNAGSHHVSWNGKDKNGNTLPSGIYYYQVKSGNSAQNVKFILIK